MQMHSMRVLCWICLILFAPKFASAQDALPQKPLRPVKHEALWELVETLAIPQNTETAEEKRLRTVARLDMTTREKEQEEKEYQARIAQEKVRVAKEREEYEATRAATTKTLKQYSPEIRLEVVAYALQEGELLPIAFYLLRNGLAPKDLRLAPYIVKVLATCDDGVVGSVLELANEIPDRRYIEPILSHAIESFSFSHVSYYREETGAGCGYSSAFGMAAALLHSLTDGKIGAVEYKRDFKLCREQDALIRQWRETWLKIKNEHAEGKAPRPAASAPVPSNATRSAD